MKMAGSKILLTGASGGIGGAIARNLAKRGASLVLVGRDAGKLDALAGELEGPGRVLTLVADIAEPRAAQDLVARAHAGVGDIDILINCAGVQTFGFFNDEEASDIAGVFGINVVAPMALTRALLPQMLSRGRGRIVNVGSIFGSIGFPCFATYSASKFALRGFSEALRRELAGTGVGVTYVAPRFTKTPFNRDVVTRMAVALKMNQDEPAAVALAIVDAIEREGRNRYLGWPEKLFVRINSLLPHFVDGALMKQVEQMRPFATEPAP
jgi:short-subunit dehydrogenase